MPASSPAWMSVMLALVAAALAPAQVHAQQHLRPVLALRAAGARVDGEDRVRAVVLAAEHLLELGRARSCPRGRPGRRARSFSTSSPASAHSTRTRVSSSWLRRRFRRPRSPSRRFRRCSIFCAPCWSCQKSGADIFCSRRAISAWILASSKVAADVRGPRNQLIEALGNVRAQTHLQTPILPAAGVTLFPAPSNWRRA